MDISLSRVFVAVTTPFLDSGDIDFSNLLKHISFIEDSGVDAIFLGGTTGEFFSLTFDEKILLLKTVRSKFNGIIVFNVSATASLDAIALAEVAEAEGADLITALPPYYISNADEDGIIRFFNEINSSTNLDLILYNFTRHSQNIFTKNILKSISYLGLKDSDKHLDMLEYTNNYLCAGDSAIVESINRGAVGVVSVQGNYRPKEVLELFNMAISNGSGDKLQKEVASVSSIFRTKNQIAKIKAGIAVSIKGYPVTVRSPLPSVSKKEIEEIGKLLIK